jgi:DNA-binding response OmpR family regulator
MELIRIFQLAMPFTPLIVVSGVKESKTRLEALAAGADELLSKPFHPAELAVRIHLRQF